MFSHTLVNNFLEHSAAVYPDKVALIHGEKRLTYAEIDSSANKLAAAMIDTGIERGDRVAVFMDNSIEAVISIFAVLKASAAFMVINHTMKSEKLEFIMNNSRARIILTQGSREGVILKIKCPHLKAIISTGPRNSGLPMISYEEIIDSSAERQVKSKCINLDLASIIYTSGSTGNPKGVMLSHLNMVSAAGSITTYLENNENDKIMNVLPLSFDYGLYQVLMAFKISGTVVLEKSFTYPYPVINTMIKEKITGFPGVPTVFAMLLQMKNIDNYDFSSIRYITNTAAALPISHIKRLNELIHSVF